MSFIVCFCCNSCNSSKRSPSRPLSPIDEERPTSGTVVPSAMFQQVITQGAGFSPRDSQTPIFASGHPVHLQLLSSQSSDSYRVAEELVVESSPEVAGVPSSEVARVRVVEPSSEVVRVRVVESSSDLVTVRLAESSSDGTTMHVVQSLPGVLSTHRNRSGSRDGSHDGDGIDSSAMPHFVDEGTRRRVEAYVAEQALFASAQHQGLPRVPEPVSAENIVSEISDWIQSFRSLPRIRPSFAEVTDQIERLSPWNSMIDSDKYQELIEALEALRSRSTGKPPILRNSLSY